MLYPTPRPGQEHQLSLSTAKCRVGEVVFQPFALVGLQQIGVMEALQLTLQNLQPHATDIVTNVFATGGNFKYRGTRERIEREIMLMMPIGSAINVAVASDPVLDTWRGAAHFANSPYFQDCAFSKKQYYESGLDYLLENKKHFSLFT